MGAKEGRVHAEGGRTQGLWAAEAGQDVFCWDKILRGATGATWEGTDRDRAFYKAGLKALPQVCSFLPTP